MRNSFPNQRECILLSILLPGERHSLEILDEFEKRTGRDFPLGSLYVTLDRMTEKGFLKSRSGKSNPQRGGNRRKYFRVSPAGSKALNAIAGLMP
jgi:PadR family transcriptional regulator PadR